MRVKVLTKRDLVALTRKAIKERKNRVPRIAEILSLPDEQSYPVSEHRLHNDREVRALVVVDATGRAVELDIDLTDFNRLPTTGNQ